ncbi:MAG: ribonuclease P protein component [Clostridia bacterium]|nr:ribonuclease P protein component [Clostridia bacterium]
MKTNGEFRRAYARGKSRTDPALVTYCVKNRAGYCGFGITASKKIGNAVCRNRCRRVIREAFRSLEANVRPGVTLVFVARSRTALKKSTEIAGIMSRQLEELGAMM